MKNVFDALYDVLDELEFPYIGISDENGYYAVQLDPDERLPFSGPRAAEKELQTALNNTIGGGVTVEFIGPEEIQIYV